MHRHALPFLLLSGLLPLGLAGCTAGYSPNNYASGAAQEEATVQRGYIIGVRQVMISASGTIGAATGGAAGGVAGSQVAGGPVVTALGAIGGTLVGGIGGTAAAQAVADMKGWEYIVQEDGEKLVSVTQTSKAPLPVGQHVLVIAGAQQARIVPDYTVQVAAAPAPKPAAPDPAKIAAAPAGSTAMEIDISPLLPTTGVPEPMQVPPIPPQSNPATPPPSLASAPSSGAVPIEAAPITPAADPPVKSSAVTPEATNKTAPAQPSS